MPSVIHTESPIDEPAALWFAPLALPLRILSGAMSILALSALAVWLLFER